MGETGKWKENVSREVMRKGLEGREQERRLCGVQQPLSCPAELVGILRITEEMLHSYFRQILCHLIAQRPGRVVDRLASGVVTCRPATFSFQLLHRTGKHTHK